MALRLFHEGTGWEQARKDTRYTAARLDARAAHDGLAKPLRGLLARWVTIDEERREADDAVVDANALVAALDDELDTAVDAFINRLLYELHGDGAHPVFKAYFPEPPSEVLRLGLESEIERTKKLFHVAEERKVSKEVSQLLAAIAAVSKRGTAALAAREAAYATTSRVTLRIQTWKESANAARRGVDSVLEGHAVKAQLPRGYADRFFPAPPRLTKKRATTPAVGP